MLKRTPFEITATNFRRYNIFPHNAPFKCGATNLSECAVNVACCCCTNGFPFYTYSQCTVFVFYTNMCVCLLVCSMCENVWLPAKAIHMKIGKENLVHATQANRNQYKNFSLVSARKPNRNGFMMTFGRISYNSHFLLVSRTLFSIFFFS